MFVAGPTAEQVVVQLQIVKDFAGGLIDYVQDGLGFVIKCGHRRQNMGTEISGLDHHLKVSFMQRGLPDYKHQLAIFLQTDVGGSGK
jgi:hypothetical protein